ncbi:hypothetical protein [Actinoplanes friuliensis]|uniref:Uncharacterized protein n=1 Tax=Actinoplanes friuliensis DSM 7358 TaxID=1246995 RepID=U5VXQ3_9ACTN|nr:hypothetical protein [Actinoplanes friuliensis]AGZ41763.1 hypothetical protein AFR_17425 [Actinoplanes friuliensis DSM 7358]
MDDAENRRFGDIAARLRDEGVGRPAPRRRRPWALIAGVVFVAAAILLLAFGGVKGAVLAIVPWLLGMACVLKGRG